MYLGTWEIDDLLTFTVTTHTFATGALTDADGNPAYRVYEDETGTAILTGTMAKLDDTNTTGHYSEQITLSAANGFEVGKSYSIYITAAVSSVTGGVVRSFQVEAAPATATALQTVDDLVDDLESRLTSTRAGYLDNLSAGAVALQGSVDDLEGRLTSTRAGYLDNLSAGAVALEATAQSILTDTGTTLDALIQDIPTNAELATALAAADDAVLAAIAALNNLSQANVRTAVGLASANLDTQLADLPTNAELATALAAADDATLAAIAALNNLSEANIRTAVGLASANLDTQLDALPTNAELSTALGTADDAVLAAIAALNNLSSAGAQAAAAAALAAYDAATGSDVPTATQVADAVLSRGVSNVQDTADVGSLAELLLGAFESAAVGTTWTIRKTGGTTFNTRTLTLDAAADPITGVT